MKKTDCINMNKYYCKTCNKEIGYKSANYGNHTCKKCAAKERAQHYVKHYYCLDCKEEVSTNRAKRCRQCWSKFFAINQIGNQYGKFRKGIKHTSRTKKKMSLTHGGTGIPYENTDYTQLFRNIRKLIRKRDNHKCQICGYLQLNNKKLDVHHINYNKEDNSLKNLISLCMGCHRKTNFNRNKWIKYFKEN